MQTFYLINKKNTIYTLKQLLVIKQIICNVENIIKKAFEARFSARVIDTMFIN